VAGVRLTIDGSAPARRFRAPSRTFVALFPPRCPVVVVQAFNRPQLGVPRAQRFSDFEYFVLASVSFSTVIPAVFESAELVRSFRFIERFARGPVFPRGGDTLAYRWTLVALGLGMTASTLLWPKQCYPFVWTGLVFLLEPVAPPSAGVRSPTTCGGDWRPWMS
jgi:hypothetical protein